MSWIDTHIDDYYTWLRSKTFIQKDDDKEWFVISTPFLGAFNDTIEIYAKKEKTKLILSDNGDTLSNLELQGFHLQSSKRRKDIVETILLNYGIQLLDGELVIQTKIEHFSEAKHNILSAIIEVNNLYVLTKTSLASNFKEEVRKFLDQKELEYTPNFISKGITGLEFSFDFQITRSNKEILIKSFNTIKRSDISSFLFSWEDVKPVREQSTQKEVNAIVIINDSNRDIKEEYLDALKTKNVDFILWSNRNSLD